MKIKLKHKQFFILYNLLAATVLVNYSCSKGIEITLFRSVMEDVYKKFYKKAIDKNKKQYIINLNDAEACAWYLFFTKAELPKEHEPETQLLRDSTLISINTIIHQKFAA